MDNMLEEKTSSAMPGLDLRNELECLGEYFGAGFLEIPETEPLPRYARAYRRWLERAPLPAYAGELLYPCGVKSCRSAAIEPCFSYTFQWDEETYARKSAGCDASAREALAYLKAVAVEEKKKVPFIDGSPHRVGGAGFTHGIVDYAMVLHEGLNQYRRRLMACEDDVFSGAMLDLLEGIEAWCARLKKAVIRHHGTCDLLAEALARVPFEPARTFHEAVVAYNVVYYLDGCDNLGRVDQVLWPYYREDKTCDEAEALRLLSALYDSVTANQAWSIALGGSDETGGAAYNPLTALCLQASHGHFRPSLELRVRDDMPEPLWEMAFDVLASGNGQPAFYNENAYSEALLRADVGLSKADLAWWNGGGCTETMIQGCSNVGSLDAGFNLPLILAETLDDVLDDDSVTFDEVLDGYFGRTRQAIEDVLDGMNRYFEARAAHRPQPIRTLLVRDCIERERDFNAGGARFNWSVVNVAGLANVADSLAALRAVVFDQGLIAPKEMREALATDFTDREPLRQALLRCPKFGNDLSEVDDLAARIAEFVYQTIMEYPCVRGRFIPSHIMFETFGWAGLEVSATPDGRHAREPLADSAGPVQGRDHAGPTAMLRSVAKLPQHLAMGTPVLNMRIAPATLRMAGSRGRLKALIRSYFQLGGMQLQISVVDREAMEDALVHPEQHGDLVVRIGGYSAYFVRLPGDLQREVLKRVEYGL